MSYELIGAEDLRSATTDDSVPLDVRASLAKILLGLTEAPTRGGPGYDVTALSGVGPPVYEARGRSVIVVYHVDHASQRVLPIRWVLYY